MRNACNLEDYRAKLPQAKWRGRSHIALQFVLSYENRQRTPRMMSVGAFLRLLGWPDRFSVLWLHWRYDTCKPNLRLVRWT